MFDAAVEAADPMRSLSRFLPEKPAGRVVVIGAGKASARMAEAVEAEWGRCEGLVITRYGYARPCEGIEIVEAEITRIPENTVEVTGDDVRKVMNLIDTLEDNDDVQKVYSNADFDAEELAKLG